MKIISVIIPAFNAEQTLSDCLHALQNQTIPIDEYEIIVVDDGSADGTATMAESMGVHIIRQANTGAAAARNVGAEVAMGELLLFTDADCVPEPDWIEAMIAPFSDASVAGAKGVYKTEQTGLTPRFVQMEYQDKYDRMRDLPQIDFVDTYSAAYRRDVFLQAGGFDTTFPGASVEDQEFSFRLASVGHKLVFAPIAVVKHHHDSQAGEYARRKFFIGYWKTLVVRLHPDKLARDSHTPQTLKLQMMLAAVGAFFLVFWLLSRKGLLAMAGILAWLGMLVSGAPMYQKIWHRDRPVLLIAPVLIFVRAWALGLGFLIGLVKLIMSKERDGI